MGEAAPILVREGARRIEIYNEGLCVYLYDAAHRDAIVAAGGWELVNLGLGHPPPKDPRLDAFARTGMLVAYELRQDDSIVVDVLVGTPPDAKELKRFKGLKWKKPQTARIALPSGRLWIDTPNSCRINPDEEPAEPGGEVSVPPGEYVLTLHRVDWDAVDDEIAEDYPGPGEVVTLTPAAEMKLPKTAGWALPYPVPGANLSWVGKYTAGDGVFNGLVNFWDYWEYFRINLDTAAFDRLGLGFGSLLEMEVGKPSRRFVVAFLGDEWNATALASCKILFGHDAMTRPLAGEPEVAYAFWQRKDPALPETLMCMRVKAGEAVDKACHGKWTKATLKVLPQRLERIDRALLGRWTRQGDAVRGTVLLRTPRYLSVNFDADALAALDAKPGDTLTLTVGEQARAVHLLSHVNAWMVAQDEMTGPFGRGIPAWDELRNAYVDAASPSAEDAVRERMRSYFLGGRPPLSAYLDRHWLERDRQILLFQPAPRDRPHNKLVFEIDLDTPPASEVLLSKQGS